MDRAPRPAGKLPAIIDRALPRRPLRLDRKQLIETIAERIETWKSLNPQIKPHAKKLRESAAIADGLGKALLAAGDKLRALGVEGDIERAKAENAALGIDGPRQPLAGRSAALDLYLTVWQALDGLQTWNRLHRGKRGAPRAFGADLTAQLQEICRKQAGLSQYEFDEVLSAVSHAEGITGLSVDTLRKRKQRGTK